jgi:hypothetical protein
MRRNYLFILLLLTCTAVNAQLKTTPICPSFVVDILDGEVNDLSASATVGQIKEKFPCFTSSEAEGTAGKCGSNVFFKDKGLYFYTGRDYVEIRPGFKGKLSIPLMGASRNGLFKWLGHPKIKDVSWDAFQMAYGTLVLYYSKAGKVNKIQFSTLPSESMNLCE